MNNKNYCDAEGECEAKDPNECPVHGQAKETAKIGTIRKERGGFTMTLSEIEHIAKIAGTYDLDFSSQMDTFIKNVFNPVSKAIESNDKIVVGYLNKCSKEERYNLYTAIEDGAMKGKSSEAVMLCEKICKEQNFKIDDRVYESASA